jgi:hypothetical protein
VITTLLAEAIIGAGSLWVRRRRVRIAWWRIAPKPLFICAAAALIGRYLASVFPGQWVISAMLVAGGILAALWVSERRDLAGLLRRVRGVAKPAGRCVVRIPALAPSWRTQQTESGEIWPTSGNTNEPP